ncbi:hypothetical protein QUF84_01140 [Fictibacillus enclensis]|uniref:hypothetical protein n=1 Tax=Fictibacillus enclensis TaxID=1017270 RepID=UPI0025A2298F|nr:hypothetical protein [Fictibacillus enclensis]MDM5335899.1 hypothetical protein [Fictibacillus enclensis]
MKKIAITSILLFSITVSTFTLNVHAEETTRVYKSPKFFQSSKQNQQIFGYFMIELYNGEIEKAVKDFYQGKDVTGYRTPDKNHYKMVSITQRKFEKGSQYPEPNSYSYALRIKIHPTNSTGIILGNDTLYFIVEPSRTRSINEKTTSPAIKLVKYSHSKP